MEVKTCRECKRLFNYLSGDCLCFDCKEKLEKKFQEVKEYINNHENVIADQIIKDCKVTMVQIKNWVSEGRLHTADEEEIYSHCEICGKAAFAGNFCNICKRQLLNDLGNAMEINAKRVIKKRKKDAPKMRFINR